MKNEDIIKTAQAVDQFLRERTPSNLQAMTALFQVLAARAALTKKDSITDAAFVAQFESMLGGVLRKALKRVRRLNADQN